jgi:hypothetical protein
MTLSNIANRRVGFICMEVWLTGLDACPVKMMLLNQARQASTDGYGYGYGYGYGHEN